MTRIFRTLTLIGVAFREQVRAEKSHIGNFWFGMLTKLVYNVMFLLFIDQLYARIGHFAGFSKNDFLFLYLISQLGFYICYYGIFYPMQNLIKTVRNGNFDLLLLKPVPHRAFLYISGMSAFELLLTALPSILIMTFLINWTTLHVSLASVLLGFVVWVCGIIICNTMVFTLVLPVFKNGDATDTLNTFYSVTAMSQMPYSKLPAGMKLAALVVFPQIIIAGATTEVVLMKADIVGTVVLLVATAAVSVVIVQMLWKYALRNYTSVSS